METNPKYTHPAVKSNRGQLPVFPEEKIIIPREKYDCLITEHALFLQICDMAHKGACTEEALKECIFSAEKIAEQTKPKPLMFYSSEEKPLDIDINKL